MSDFNTKKENINPKIHTFVSKEETKRVCFDFDVPSENLKVRRMDLKPSSPFWVSKLFDNINEVIFGEKEVVL